MVLHLALTSLILGATAVCAGIAWWYSRRATRAAAEAQRLVAMLAATPPLPRRPLPLDPMNHIDLAAVAVGDILEHMPASYTDAQRQRIVYEGIIRAGVPMHELPQLLSRMCTLYGWHRPHDMN